jgi:hypothetical protein
MKHADLIKERETDIDVSSVSSTVGGRETLALPAGRKSEKGVVLVVVLILSGVVLAVMTALIYMITSGTQISGMQRRYKTSLEAAHGGSDIFYQMVGLRGVAVDDNVFRTDLTNAGLTSSLPIETSTCSGVSHGTTYTGWQAKLMTPSTSWTANCNGSITIDPNDPTTYDMSIELGATTTYKYYAKVVRTIDGNSGGDTGLFNKGVVSTGSGEIQAMPKPYLYDIEVLASSTTNTVDRAKYSILYQY